MRVHSVRGPWSDHPGRVWSVEFSPDGERLLSVGRDGNIILRDLIEGALIGEPWAADGGALSGGAFTPDGSRVISAGEDGVITFWDVREAGWREAAC